MTVEDEKYDTYGEAEVLILIHRGLQALLEFLDVIKIFLKVFGNFGDLVVFSSNFYGKQLC